TVEVAEPRNVARFAILPPVANPGVTRIRVGNEHISARQNPAGSRQGKIVLARRDGRWVTVDDVDPPALEGKRPGLQGPIDDAFTTPFLCVRGTGQPWNPAVGAWADATLRRFGYEWARYMRGDLPLKNDTEITDE